jgi:phage shock protein A
MSALLRLFERARAEIAGIGDALAGSHAQRVVDQEIRATDAQLHGWRQELDALLAQRYVAHERLAASAQAIDEREAQAVLALQAGDPALARDVAAAIVLIESQRDEHTRQVADFDEHIAQMRRVMTQSENTLRRLHHQLDTIRATESVQRAQEAVARRGAGEGALRTALDAAERAKHATPATRETILGDTQIESAFAELDARLRRAGIGDTDLRTETVMQRIQARVPTPPAQKSSTKPRKGSTR